MAHPLARRIAVTGTIGTLAVAVGSIGIATAAGGHAEKKASTPKPVVASGATMKNSLQALVNSESSGKEKGIPLPSAYQSSTNGPVTLFPVRIAGTAKLAAGKYVANGDASVFEAACWIATAKTTNPTNWALAEQGSAAVTGVYPVKKNQRLSLWCANIETSSESDPEAPPALVFTGGITAVLPDKVAAGSATAPSTIVEPTQNASSGARGLFGK